MIRDDLLKERASKKEIAIKDFYLLSKEGVIGRYIECELTHIFIIEKEKSICHHYFAICNYEEFKELDSQLRDKHITKKLIKINKKYSLGIIQKRISTDESNNLFEQLCLGTFNFKENNIVLPLNLQLLPKVHIPQYWDGTTVFLQKVLKPNFWGDTYIIEFISIDNPFSCIFTTNEFDKINLKIKELSNIDLLSINDRIGSFIFQFPITIISANCNIFFNWCKARLSIEFHNHLVQSLDIYTLVNTKFDDVITGFNAIEGIVDNFEFDLGDSNNFEYLIINKNKKIIYKHFMGNYLRHVFISGNFNIQYSEPRTIPYKKKKTVEIELFNHNLISVGNDHNIDDRIQNRILNNSIIKQSGDFYVFDMGQRVEALNCIREKINNYSGSSSEIWLWDPYLRCEDIFNTLYYANKIGIIMKCITSYKKIKNLKKQFDEELIDFETFKNEQKQAFHSSNNIGINLEFRSTHDQIGSNFHDRFLIFLPEDNSKLPIIYSLGTSINSLGLGHHVIQRTLDPRKIVYYFDKLWLTLSADSTSLIIKLPETKI